MNINSMITGRELDALVAEKVMGLRVVEDQIAARGLSTGEAGRNGRDLMPYSTDIAAAWKVVDHLKGMGKGFALNWVVCGGGKPKWLATFSDHGVCEAETAPLAICLAALKAVGL